MLHGKGYPGSAASIDDSRVLFSFLYKLIFKQITSENCFIESAQLVFLALALSVLNFWMSLYRHEVSLAGIRTQNPRGCRTFQLSNYSVYQCMPFQVLDASNK